MEGLKASLAGAQQKLSQVGGRIRRPSTVDLGIPALQPSPLLDKG
ncbi:hypothetical protein [Streptomyces canus]